MLKYLLVLSVFISSVFSSTLISINDNKIYNNFEVLYLQDNNSSLTIEDISKKQFTQTTSNSFTLGYVKGTIWMKFDINNKTKFNDFILTLNESFYEVANLYFYDKDWIKKSNSVFNLIKNREIKTNHLAFDLTL